MPVLKFWIKENVITLEKYRMEDITKDSRTKYLDVEKFAIEKYKIAENIYMIINDLFFTMAKIFNSGPEIHSMILHKDNIKLIFIPSKSYVFWDGKSIEPQKYEFSAGEMRQVKLDKTT